MPAVPFEYHAPATLEEVIALLRKHGDEAKPLAGGQSLVPLLTLRLARPAVLVDLNHLEELRAVRREGDALWIGALVRHRALERGEGALRACPLLQDAAALIGNVRVRALGTIGGSLAHADPAAELPAVVQALDGTVALRGPQGERHVPAGDFFVGALTTALGPAEVIVGVRLPVLGPGVGYAVEEFSRRAGDFAVVAAIAVVELRSPGEIARARVALAGVGSTPRRLPGVEAALAGQLPGARAAGRGPPDHHRAGVGRRRRAASPAGGVCGPRGRPVRLLHPRHDPDRVRLSRGASRAVAGRDPAGDRGKPLPLHRLHQDHRRHRQRRRPEDAWLDRSCTRPRSACASSAGPSRVTTPGTKSRPARCTPPTGRCPGCCTARCCGRRIPRRGSAASTRLPPSPSRGWRR